MKARVHAITCLRPWTSGNQRRSARHWGKIWHSSCLSNSQPSKACNRMFLHDFWVVLGSSHYTEILKGEYKYPWELPGTGRILSASSHRGRVVYAQQGNSEPRVEKRIGSVIPEFWALPTNPEIIPLGQCLWKFLLQVRDVLWGKRRVGRKECTVTFFCNFLAPMIHQSHRQMTFSPFPMQE